MCTDSNVGAGDLSRALRQQLLATVISTASQIQMEKGSHSVAPLIMYGTDGAARLWTTGGPSHVPVEPSANVLQITHVSPRFTKHLYLAPHSQRRKVPNLFQYGPKVGRRDGNEQTVRAFRLLLFVVLHTKPALILVTKPESGKLQKSRRPLQLTSSPAMCY